MIYEKPVIRWAELTKQWGIVSYKFKWLLY